MQYGTRIRTAAYLKLFAQVGPVTLPDLSLASKALCKLRVSVELYLAFSCSLNRRPYLVQVVLWEVKLLFCSFRQACSHLSWQPCRTFTRTQRSPVRTVPCAAIYQEREKRTPKLGRSTSKQTPTRQAPTPRRAEIAEDNVPWYKRAYINITGFPFPLGPLFSRRTIRYEVKAFSLTAAIQKVASLLRQILG